MLSRVSMRRLATVRSVAHSVAPAPTTQCRALSTIKTSISDNVATITLNRPKQLNALTVEMGREFRSVVDDLMVNTADIGAVVVTGEGRAFSAGGDLKYLMDRSEDSPHRNSVLMRRFYEHFLCLRQLPVPVIAAINGPAIGAGLCMAMGCDIRIAAESAKLGVTFVKLGLHPGMGATHFMPQIVGPQAAARMMLTGDVVDGKEAADMGLVLKAVPDADVVAEALALAKTIASQSPEAVRSCLRSIRMKQDEGLDKALWREADSQATNFASRDLREGVSATAEKRVPDFRRYDQYHFEQLRRGDE